MTRKDYALLLMAFAFLVPAIPFAWAEEDEAAPAPAPAQPASRAAGQGVTPQAACVGPAGGTINENARARTGESQTTVDPVTGEPIARPGR
jgi:hypothetical protein